MLCKHCGTTLRSSTKGNNVPVLVGRFGGEKCFQSPNGKHIGCAGEMMVCKYCGTKVRSSTTGNNVPILFGQQGPNCPSSPYSKHELAD
jgi:hypothetical protein